MHHLTLTPYPTGAVVCHCDTCGRRFVIQPQPYKRIILVEGDAAAEHAGGMGGITISAGVQPGEDNNRLDVFRDFLDGK